MKRTTRSMNVRAVHRVVGCSLAGQVTPVGGVGGCSGCLANGASMVASMHVVEPRNTHVAGNCALVVVCGVVGGWLGTAATYSCIHASINCSC